MTQRLRQCPRCGTLTPAGECCGAAIQRAKPWRMTKQLVRNLHIFAMSRKGLDAETYRLQLERVGVTTSKDLRRDAYMALMRNLRALPDSPRWKPRGKGRAAA